MRDYWLKAQMSSSPAVAFGGTFKNELAFVTAENRWREILTQVGDSQVTHGLVVVKMLS